MIRKISKRIKIHRNGLFYIGTICTFSWLMYLIVRQGTMLESDRQIRSEQAGVSQWQEFTDTLLNNLHHPLAILLAQITTIIVIARVFGWVFRKIGQPSVIGEIIAGIVLGPSLAGWYFPELSAALFPAQSLGNLQFLSQIGLILFMFVIGMELDLSVLKTKANEALVISHTSIIGPFALGMVLAYFIYDQFAPADISFLAFSLFMGIAMSITAFPVLARIVQERGIHKTKLGTIAITCAAADDITAWCLLAAVIAVVKAGTFISSLYTIAMAVFYVYLMIRVVRPFLKRVGELYYSKEQLSKPIVAIFFLTLLLSSFATEVIGIHALFGAFMAGAIMPESARFRNIFIEKVEDVATVLLLPLFFVYTGLRTQIGLLNDPSLWQVAGLIILVAVIGKFAGSAVAARFVGQNWKDSLSIGALMNTRGLMELVVLNIGYDLGVLTPEIFAMMVIMALVTTFMTGPALDLINRIFPAPAEEQPHAPQKSSPYKVLFYFDYAESIRALMILANSLTHKFRDHAAVTALHMSPVNDLHYFDEQEYESGSFNEVEKISLQLNQRVNTLFKASDDIDHEIAGIANKGDYDLLLIGMRQSIFEGSLLGKILGFTGKIINPEKIINTLTGRESWVNDTLFDERTQSVVLKSRIPTGVLVDKGLTHIENVFVPLFGKNDAQLMTYARKLVHHIDARISVLDVAGESVSAEIKEHIQAIETEAPEGIAVLHDRKIDKELLRQYDLMLISLDSWKQLIASKSIWLSSIPSTLILHQK